MLSEMSSSFESSSSTRVREEKRRLESVCVREKRRLIVLFYSDSTDTDGEMWSSNNNVSASATASFVIVGRQRIMRAMVRV